MRYPGGKSGSGVYQRIINRIPPHRVYVEPFLGGGSVMRFKLPAELNVGVDLDPRVLPARARTDGSGDWVQPGHTAGSGGCCPGWLWLCGDGIELLRTWEFGPEDVVYCDPPYLMETRRRQRPMYRCELEAVDHRRLLAVLASLPCRVLVSGYRHAMYDDALSSWTRETYRTMTRAGESVEEVLWYNYPRPDRLHDTRYLGGDYRERERIRKRQRRWVARLRLLPSTERAALEAALREVSADTA